MLYATPLSHLMMQDLSHDKRASLCGGSVQLCRQTQAMIESQRSRRGKVQVGADEKLIFDAKVEVQI